jgi:DNA-binding GntR family transcriptional regulator
MQTTPLDKHKPSPKLKNGQDIYEILRDRIIQWYYPPKYHLGEKNLCEEFTVSRVPIREALRALTTDGFVEKVPNQGCFVKQLNVGEAKELFDVRVALERFVVEILISNDLPIEWLDHQQALWQSMLEGRMDTIDVSDFVRYDNDFHLGLAKASLNTNIVRILEDVTERLSFIKLSVEITSERLTETAKEHLAILQAIHSNNANTARDAIKHNIEHSKNRVELAISRALLAAHSM